MKKQRAIALVTLASALTGFSAQAEIYTAGKNPCDVPVDHTARSDVAYAGDVDANSTAIAPTEITPPQDFLPDAQRIFLDIPITEYVDGSHYNVALDEAVVNVGDIDVAHDGEVKFNGKKLPQKHTMLSTSDCE